MALDLNQNDIHENKDCLQLNELKGATITNIGFTTQTSEGGLTIDFIKDGQNKRIIIGTNDLGTWIHFYGDRKEFTNEERKEFQDIVDLKQDIMNLWRKPPNYRAKISDLSNNQKNVLAKRHNVKVKDLKNTHISDLFGAFD